MESSENKGSRYGIGVLVGLVVVAALLTQMEWTSLLSSDGDGDFEFMNVGPFQIAINMEPETPRVGLNRIVIRVLQGDGTPVRGAEVRAVAEMAAMGAMPPMRSAADIQETEPGVYRGELELTMTGEWPLAVDVATDGAHHVDMTFDLATGRPGLSVATATPVGDVAYHTCSMHPSVRSAVPGTCPICGMNLVAVTREEVQSGAIRIDSQRRQAIGVTTGEAFLDRMWVPVRLVGQVAYDETKLQDISLRFDGWIGELFANEEGQPVRKGEPLFTVYSPALLALQEEYLNTHRRKVAVMESEGLLAAARKRLELWGLSAAQIRWLEEQPEAPDYLPIFSPFDGAIITKGVVSGSSFRSGDRLLRLADLSSVWVEAFAYERDMNLLAPGMAATLQIPHSDGEPLQARLDRIDPFLRSGTRTVRARIALPNTEQRLRPGQFVDVTFLADRGKRLMVPEQAVLVSGDRRVVFRDLGDGRIKPQFIRTGFSNGHCVEVLDGLAPGDAIITSGNFLIASESKLKSGVVQW